MGNLPMLSQSGAGRDWVVRTVVIRGIRDVVLGLVLRHGSLSARQERMEAGVRGIPSPFIKIYERGRDTPHPGLWSSYYRVKTHLPDY
jgi:hypothetical protein